MLLENSVAVARTAPANVAKKNWSMFKCKRPNKSEEYITAFLKPNSLYADSSKPLCKNSSQKAGRTAVRNKLKNKLPIVGALVDVEEETAEYPHKERMKLKNKVIKMFRK